MVCVTKFADDEILEILFVRSLHDNKPGFCNVYNIILVYIDFMRFMMCDSRLLKKWINPRHVVSNTASTAREAPWAEDAAEFGLAQRRGLCVWGTAYVEGDALSCKTTQGAHWGSIRRWGRTAACAAEQRSATGGHLADS